MQHVHQHVCIVFPRVGLCFLVLLRHIFHTWHIELFNLFCNTCALCYNSRTIFGTCPVSLVPFPYWLLIYNWRDTNTSTVNWYRGLYVQIYIVWILYSHVLFQGLVQRSHYGFLKTYVMGIMKYTCVSLRKFETLKHYIAAVILLLSCHTWALTIH